MLRFACPNCDKVMTAGDSASGKKARCPACQTLFLVPGEMEPASESASPSRDYSPRESFQRDQPSPRATADDDVREGVLEEDEEPEERERRPRRKKRRRRRRRSGPGVFSFLGDVDPFLIFLGIIALVWLTMFLIALAAPAVGFMLALFGYFTATAGGIWMLVMAFSEDVTTGLLCLFVPFYGLYFLISNWDQTQRPFFIEVLGWGMVLTGIMTAANL